MFLVLFGNANSFIAYCYCIFFICHSLQEIVIGESSCENLAELLIRLIRIFLSNFLSAFIFSLLHI
jgi:hypothetical protein